MTRSTPSISFSGNITPTSMITMSRSFSKTKANLGSGGSFPPSCWSVPSSDFVVGESQARDGRALLSAHFPGGSGAILPNRIVSKHNFRYVPNMDGLDIVDKLWPKARALATSVSEKDGKEHPVIWVNDFHGTRVFGTTLGHHNETVQAPEFLDLLTSGTLWAAGALDTAHLKKFTPTATEERVEGAPV